MASIFIFLIGFYYFFKAGVYRFSPVIARQTSLIKYHPFSQVVGAVELSSISVLHVIFCILLALFFHINLIPIFLNSTITDCLCGVLIGMGSVCTAILLCTVAIKIVECVVYHNDGPSLDEWTAISGAGWMRHYKHTIKLFPLVIAILIITLQIGSEEIIFRGILIPLFEPYGAGVAFIVSTVLFVLMQWFHMPSLISAMFPVIGATVMGIIHGFLYIHHAAVTPLIISHLTFLLFYIL
jgi:membrane protease YdiL (CAAX protease family)